VAGEMPLLDVLDRRFAYTAFSSSLPEAIALVEKRKDVFLGYIRK